MEKVKLIDETKHYFLCPHCNVHKFPIDHLININTDWGPWYCDDCGWACKGEVNNCEVLVEKTLKRKDKSLVFLKKDNVLLAVEGNFYNDKIDLEHSKYYYETHTCPINYLRNVVEIINLDTNDNDPHGVFEFVDEIPYNEDKINKCVEKIKNDPHLHRNNLNG